MNALTSFTIFIEIICAFAAGGAIFLIMTNDIRNPETGGHENHLLARRLFRKRLARALDKFK